MAQSNFSGCWSGEGWSCPPGCETRKSSLSTHHMDRSLAPRRGMGASVFEGGGQEPQVCRALFWGSIFSSSSVTPYLFVLFFYCSTLSWETSYRGICAKRGHPARYGTPKLCAPPLSVNQAILLLMYSGTQGFHSVKTQPLSFVNVEIIIVNIYLGLPAFHVYLGYFTQFPQLPNKVGAIINSMQIRRLRSKVF